MANDEQRTSYARVRAAPETDAAGLTGRIGLVVGETRPSASGVSVVGEAPDDYARAVHFDDLGETFWFRPELLEAVYADGRPFVPAIEEPWHDRSLDPAPPPDETPVTRLLKRLEQFLPKLG